MSVRLDGVSFRYPGSPDHALKNVSAECRVGQVTLVTGRLGAGASTLLLTMAGLAPHATGGTRDGDVRALGHDPASAEGREALAGRVGVLLPTPWTQLSGMGFSVRDEVAFGPANLGWSRERIAEAVERTLSLVEVLHLGDRDPRTLSGGELQRVMIAAIAVTGPELFLFDEPTLELDPESAERVYGLLPALAASATVVVASTDQDRAAGIADRVLFLDRGVLVAGGGPVDVLGGERAVVTGCSTTVAEIARAAGSGPPYPLTVEAAVARFGG